MILKVSFCSSNVVFFVSALYSVSVSQVSFALACAGGVRAAAFISGGLIPPSRQGSKLLLSIHVADWLPTFCRLAGLDSADRKAFAAGLPPVDGVDVWPQIVGTNTTEPHVEIVLSQTSILDVATGYKLMTGTQRYNTWAPKEGWPPDYECRDRNSSTPLHCGTAGNAGSAWGCLFHIPTDPEERHDLSTNASVRSTLATLQKRYLAMLEGVWHNCDAPSTCQNSSAEKYCEHVKTTCDGVYCPVFGV